MPCDKWNSYLILAFLIFPLLKTYISNLEQKISNQCIFLEFSATIYSRSNCGKLNLHSTFEIPHYDAFYVESSLHYFPRFYLLNVGSFVIQYSVT